VSARPGERLTELAAEIERLLAELRELDRQYRALQAERLTRD
jgi:hypothetical protein